MALSHVVYRGGDRGREVALLTHATPAPRRGAAGPYRLLAYDELGSTNDTAMARLRAGDPGGLVVQAVRQTGGRGRQGRAWASPPGNLYASLALNLDVAPAVAPQLGFVAGVALARVLRARLGGNARLRIKWPNDMIFAGAKLAGLLLESGTLPQGRIACVIGFGINCRTHPDDLPYPATDLTEAGDPAADPDALLAALAEEFAIQLALWDHGTHFETIRQAWLSQAVEIGTRLAVTLPNTKITGTFAGLDPSGRLLLKTGAETTRIDAGDVFLPEIVI